MKADQFSLPYLQRPCPKGVVPEVWKAFAECADCSSSERAEKWLAYLEVHRKYYDKDGNRLTQEQLKIF
jgi:hypothetical protein